ncbi:hypothetical protein B0H10DRAFT_2196126 [Mycena sp. CBHHK59/15]|nr:hypothetical protein B0H10DRAFT_2196126 [Mycena sp. CBHHK59/15]
MSFKLLKVFLAKPFIFSGQTSHKLFVKRLMETWSQQTTRFIMGGGKVIPYVGSAVDYQRLGVSRRGTHGGDCTDAAHPRPPRSSGFEDIATCVRVVGAESAGKVGVNSVENGRMGEKKGSQAKGTGERKMHLYPYLGTLYSAKNTSRASRQHAQQLKKV